MVEAVAERGYRGTTVRYVRALAGVSERTVYQHFESKRTYFLATYEQVMRELIGRLAAAARDRQPEDGDWQARLRRVLDWA